MEKGAKVLLTGGAGYIGSHIAYELCSAGCSVSIIDNFSSSSIRNFTALEREFGTTISLWSLDLCDILEAKHVIKTIRPEYVIHLAAFKAVGESMGNPLKYYSNNIGAMVGVLEGMKESGCHHLVLSSSCTVYGDTDSFPLTEDSPIGKALSPYGMTKQVCERMIRDIAEKEEWLSCISLRYFNPIGAHPSGIIGEMPLGAPNNILPYITSIATGKRSMLKIFGKDYDTPDGTCLRDYVDVNDLAEAHIMALDRVGNGLPYDVFNIGTGNPVSTLQLVRQFEEANGIKIPYEFTARRQGDVEKAWASVEKARTGLGWYAKTPLSGSLRSAYNWELNN